jgi:sec-independent protein translocase protein TatB
MRALGRFTRQARKLAGEFQGHVNDLIREAELADMKQSVQQISQANVGTEIDKLLDPSGEFAAELARTEEEMKIALQSVPSTSVTPPPPAVAATPAAPTSSVPHEGHPHEGAS